jgi:hypothetical protein
MAFKCRSSRRFLAAAALLSFYAAFFASAHASTNSGIDTPMGVTSLPLAVEGVEGMVLLNSNPPAGPVYVGIAMTNPGYPLDVNGIIHTAVSTDQSWIGSVTATGSGGTTGILAGQINNAYWTGVAGHASASNGVGVYGYGAAYGGYFDNGINLNSGALRFPDGTTQTTAATNQFGGMYFTAWENAPCKTANPYTGGCSCPAWASVSHAIGQDFGMAWGGGALFYCASM